MEFHQSCHAFTEQATDRFGSVPAVAGVVAGDQYVADVVEQARDLEFFVGGVIAAQQLRALPIVIEDVDGIAGAVRGVPGVGAPFEEFEQVVDSVYRGDGRATGFLDPAGLDRKGTGPHTIPAAGFAGVVVVPPVGCGGVGMVG